MGLRIDMEGKKCGRLTVLERDGKNTGGEIKWKCICECGNIVSVKGSSLRSGITKSCGCYQKEAVKKANAIHGKCSSRLYRIWNAMKTRCYNPKSKSYINYGQRGIRICDEWLHNYSSFYNWAMSHGYNDTLTIDRINNNGNYEPNNCRWLTRAQQNQNKRPWNCNKN